MSDPTDAILDAIKSAFETHPREGDPDWRSPAWIMPEECAHLTRAVAARAGRVMARINISEKRNIFCERARQVLLICPSC